MLHWPFPIPSRARSAELRRRWLEVGFATIVLTGFSGFLASAHTEAPPNEKPTLAEQREVNRLVSQFRRHRKDRQKQADIVRQAMRLGRPAVLALSAAVNQEVYPALDRYRAKFDQQAALVYRQKVGKIDLQEVARLRAIVLSLQHGPNFTKETIVEKADPAIERLVEILLARRDDILNRSADLRAERRKFQELGMLWEACAAYLYHQTPADADKPKNPPTFAKYLEGEEDLAIGLAAPMDPRTHEILVANSKLAPQLDPEEARAILALNLTRNLLGLPALATDLRLCAAARDHSQDMRTHKFFSHESPVEGKKTPWDRARRFGVSASGENIFMGVEDGAAANLAWFHSPGHHRNMLGDHAHVGMGRSGVYFTQLFGK